jgi:hypothetical protein
VLWKVSRPSLDQTTGWPSDMFSAELGRSYERKALFQLAVPLFFQALRICDSPCHRAVLSTTPLPNGNVVTAYACMVLELTAMVVNNLAVSFAQHPPLPVLTAPLEGAAAAAPDASATPSTRREHLEAAHNWAFNAYTHAKDVGGEERTAECDEACAVALCNLGDILAMAGRPSEARRRFEECIDMSKAIDFPDGVSRAQSGLDRVKEQLS